MTKSDFDKLATELGIYEWSLKEWMVGLMSIPVKKIDGYNRSEGYDNDSGVLLLLENGKFAYVRECGCSCYDASQAEIFVKENEQDARELFVKGKDGRWYE